MFYGPGHTGQVQTNYEGITNLIVQLGSSSYSFSSM